MMKFICILQQNFAKKKIKIRIKIKKKKMYTRENCLQMIRHLSSVSLEAPQNFQKARITCLLKIDLPGYSQNVFEKKFVQALFA